MKKEFAQRIIIIAIAVIIGVTNIISGHNTLLRIANKMMGIYFAADIIDKVMKCEEDSFILLFIKLAIIYVALNPIWLL